MAIVVNMPRLSDTMEEGTVASWLKKVGDRVEEGDILAEIETDKATMEFESFNEGILLHIGVNEGETTKVDELLAIIGEEGEDISALIEGRSNAESEDISENISEVTLETEATAKDPESSTAEMPEGVIVVTMPRLSDTMEEGTVASWLKNVGDFVEEGEILAEIETDKATMEFESFNEGTLLHIGLSVGESANVDDLLAIIGPKGTDVSGVAQNFKTVSAETKTEEATKTKNESSATMTVVETPKVEPPKNEDPVTTMATNGRIYISPLAKKIAEEKGIALDQVQG
ncbi:MAG: biotin/lipoyl-containing protein, partial [Bacteroidota bacterium]|nr:biotin/lipoyl-containing protein [Bacteroidota bacterium]